MLAGVTIDDVNATLNETFSGTVPEGEKLRTPLGVAWREEAANAAEAVSINTKTSKKNLCVLLKINNPFFMG